MSAPFVLFGGRGEEAMGSLFGRRGVVALLALATIGSVGVVPAVAAAGNDDFADRVVLPALVLNGPTVSVTGDNLAASTEGGEPDACAAGATVWYEISVPAAGRLTLSTAGSDFDTTLGLYQGSSVDALTRLNCNDDYEWLESRVVSNVDAGTYAVQMGGFAGNEGSFALAVTLTDRLPLGFAGDEPSTAPVVSLPVDVSIDLAPYTSSPADEASYCYGFPQTAWLRVEPLSDVVLEVGSESEGVVVGVVHPVGTEVEAMTCSGYRIDETGYAPGVRFGLPLEAGETYFVQISSFDSDGVVGISLSEAVAPANDDLANAIALERGVRTFGTVIGSTQQEGEPTNCGEPSRGSVWYRYDDRASLASDVGLRETDEAASLNLYRGASLEDLELVDCGWDGASALKRPNESLYVQVVPESWSAQGSFRISGAIGAQRCAIVACVAARAGDGVLAYASGPLAFVYASKEPGYRPFVCAGVLLFFCF